MEEKKFTIEIIETDAGITVNSDLKGTYDEVLMRTFCIIEHLLMGFKGDEEIYANIKRGISDYMKYDSLNDFIRGENNGMDIQQK